MSKPAQMRSKWLGALMVVFLSVTFLMGDFCEDVTSVPIELKYPSASSTDSESGLVDVVVDFAEGAEVPDDLDGDEEIPDDLDGDEEVPNEDVDYSLLDERICPNKFSLGLHHHTVDLTKTNKLLASGADALKKKLVGVFIRSVTYSIENNTIPIEDPKPLKVYISKKYQGYEDANGDEMDWDTLEAESLSVTDNGIGDEDLVLLGTVEPIHYRYPTTQVFPSEDKILDRAEANLDLLSDVITDSFTFEVVILSDGDVCIGEEYREEIMTRDDPRGVLTLKLGMVVVAVVKPL